MSKVIWMFSGQGSQYFDMGRDLYEADPVFRDMMHSCDAHCERILGASIVQIIYPADKKLASQPFDNLLHTHPALLCIQYSLAQTLLRRGMKPDLLLGYSLGEWIALTVGGALPFSVALESFVEQAEMLQRTAQPGAMLAVMASPDIVSSAPVYEDTSIAAYNLDNHFVLSGLTEPVQRVRRVLRADEISHQLLPVNVAFHSPHMDALEASYRDQVSLLRIGSLTCPLVSLAHGRVVEELPEDFFWNVLRRPVRFDETIRSIEADGSWRFVDLGPSGTLATFLKYLLEPDSASAIYPVVTPFRQATTNLERLEREL